MSGAVERAVRTTKKASGKGGHHLRPFWPYNASSFDPGIPGARPTSHKHGARRL